MQDTAKIRDQEIGAAALSVLVKQFAGKFDFIRELVQNSLDSGTATVEVWTAYRRLEGGGVCEIHVDDNGTGMDEAIIDSKLTMLFSSSKEDDLTHIGKFGIGFASVFSLEPEGVLVRTARGGERWEVFFNKDRTFEKTRIDDPIEGTKVTVFKEMGTVAYRNAVKSVVSMLSFWCKHAEKRILFHDTAAKPIERIPKTPGRRERRAAMDKREINQPFVVEGDFPVLINKGETTIAMAFSPKPFFGFYNHGLTLKEADGYDILGWAAPYFQNVAFKIKSGYLEHTLTRDTILINANYEKALLLLVNGAREELVENLLKKLEALAAAESLKGAMRQEYFSALKWLYGLQLELDPTFGFEERLKDVTFNAGEQLRRAVADIFEPNRQKKGRQKSIDASKRKLFRRCHGSPVALDEIRKSIRASEGRLMLSSSENEMTVELDKHSKPVFLSPVTAKAKRFFEQHLSKERNRAVKDIGTAMPTVFGVGDRVWLFENITADKLNDNERALLNTIANFARSAALQVFAVNFLGDNPTRYILGGKQISHNMATTLPMGRKTNTLQSIAIDINGRLFQKLAALYAEPKTRDAAVLIAARDFAKCANLNASGRLIVTEEAEDLLL